MISKDRLKASQICFQIFERKSVGSLTDTMSANGPLILLDELGIYGERIEKFWEHVCKADMGKMLLILRAYQTKRAEVNREKLNFAIDNLGSGVDLDLVIEVSTTDTKNRSVTNATEPHLSR